MKKGLAGLVVGSAVAFVAYQSLSEARKTQLRQTARDTWEDLKENAIDYALIAEDTAGDFLDSADEYKETLQEKVQDAGDKLTAKKDQAVAHFSNDNFDEQTASIREQLSSASHDDEDDSDDIVIDKTDTEPTEE